MTPLKTNVLLLGSTGFLGSTFLKLIGQDSDLKDRLHITVLCRNSAKRFTELQKFYSDLEVVECNLEDDAVIQDHAAKTDIVINAASSDHTLTATLRGLEKNSAANPNKPPMYLQVSGLGITSDNSHGEYVNIDDLPGYVDIDFSLDQVPQENTHLPQDKLIVEAGTRTKNPVRTAIVFPGWIYGVGEAIQQTTLPVRIWVDMFLRAGYAGTWGEGHSIMGNAHVKDVASALATVLKAMLDGKADEGAKGFYFAISRQRMVSNREIASKIGDILFEHGLAKKGGSRPYPPEIVEPLGFYGWSLLGANQMAHAHHLSRFGWKPAETKKVLLMESLREEVLVYLRQLGKIPA
ncbi:hypothetical protein AGABI1DRAFT_105483 [Agaricus bisporus var. burnettii JB137-S8]|uniref:Saccharopine dehydrogenase NADP binding domain-containing protein n=1 Tax=Agaricus bisporus var. burnettii (strain JB137-S8 / ATCC MYA-4627 / FGSC 10392) TaxID=597362 RepID=K5XFI2_AGABU|nr:uncharacterized protein AGABI1DRAFT_105483 [Agaricus bisporus var. burnettii JB137-S8]EKM82153.1 hypothetical protein AGABI1DRAFT_105483 [Agaricus bisporus var. burnettii JB137-S8]